DLVFQRVSKLHLATTAQLIRLQGSIIRDTLEAEEVYNLMELEIESKEDVTKAREIVKDNLDGMGQHIGQLQTYSSQRHRQGSRRLLEDILVSWDGYQLVGNSNILSWLDKRVFEIKSVPNQNIMEEEDAGVHSLEEPTFEQLMDEVDKLKEVAQEKPKSPYDTESEIKIIKSFQVNIISNSLLIHQGLQRSTSDDINVIDITPKDDEEGDASDFDLHSMPSDNLASLTGFETPDSDDEASISVNKEHSADNLMETSDGDVALPNAFEGVSTLSDPLGHLQRESSKRTGHHIF
ncbi:hypothetical protein Tco_1243351, partial [Tanacetum coccineum]